MATVIRERVVERVIERYVVEDGVVADDSMLGSVGDTSPYVPALPAPRLTSPVLVQEYLASLALKAPSTTRHYRQCLEAYLAYLLRLDVHILDANDSHVASFLAATYTVASRRQGWKGISTFYGWAIRRHLVAYSPLAGVRAPKEPAPHRLAPSREHVLGAIAKAHGERKLLLSLAYATGARIAELAMMDFSDVDIVGKRIRVPANKGAEAHWANLPVTVLAMLPENGRGKIFGGKSIRTLRRYIVDSLGLSPHYLRHAMCTHALEAGAPRAAVIRQAGHADGRMLDRVYTLALRDSAPMVDLL